LDPHTTAKSCLKGHRPLEDKSRSRIVPVEETLVINRSNLHFIHTPDTNLLGTSPFHDDKPHEPLSETRQQSEPTFA
jgi:hypothetical protein